jgi:hypothetical protein
MHIDRVDAAMAIRPYMVLALKREFLSSGFGRQLPTQLFSLDLVGDQFGEEGYVAQSSAAKDRFPKPTTAVRSPRREPLSCPFVAVPGPVRRIAMPH